MNLLPRHGHYKGALAEDMDSAREMVRLGLDKDMATTPPVAGWSPVVDMLAALNDRVCRLIEVTIAANSQNGRQPKLGSISRPQTALERAQQEAALDLHHWIVSQLLPGR